MLLAEQIGIDVDDQALVENYMDYVFDLLKDESKLRIRIINTDQKMLLDSGSVGSDFLPTEDDEWDVAPAWILVGGDILGRGLTIPHLTTTFFLRNPKSPTFDTAVQQMRFCGYRDSYKKFVRVYAPTTIFENYLDIWESDKFLRGMANSWDEESRNLKQDPPKFVHLKSKSTRVKMTRRSVTSGYLRASTAAGKSGFTRIEKPQSYADFSSSLDSLTLKLHDFDESGSGVYDVPVTNLFDILEVISGERELATNTFAVSGILQDQNLAGEALGANVKLVLDLPSGISSILEFKTSLPELVAKGLSTTGKVLSYRSTQGSLSISFEEWVQSSNIVPGSEIKELVGDSERRIRAAFNDHSVLLVKPIALTDDSKHVKAVTLTATLWLKGDAPDFVVHTEGPAA